MATAHMPDEFFDPAVHHLPPEPPVGPAGGRPRVGHRPVLRVIWFVLATGCRWEDVPAELGCSGRTAHRRRRGWEGAGIWDRRHADRLRLLRAAGTLDLSRAVIDGVYVRAFGGGEATGPSPAGRAEPGSKHTLMVSRTGVPLAVRTAGANATDHTQLFPLLVAVPKVGGKPGRPKPLPDVASADRGYDSDSARRLLAGLGAVPRIADRAEPHGSGLGTVRRVAERTISWLKGRRRMRVRYDRLTVVRDALTTLAAAIICFRILHQDAM